MINENELNITKMNIENEINALKRKIKRLENRIDELYDYVNRLR